ncbi:MAG: DUF2889 domain-containing protein [Burkholderiales bacterium]
MPLPPSPRRTEVHLRSIEMRGYRRDDGLYEIDGRVVDTRSAPITLIGGEVRDAGDAIHDMSVRLVVDDDLVVRDVRAVSDATPFPVCAEAANAMRAIVGERIKAGWSLMVKAKLGGVRGCTHLMELLIPLATAAYQTLTTVRLARPDVLDARGRPVKIDSCYAYAAHRDIVKIRWPAHHVADADGVDTAAGDRS